jgi:hypothetical protein
LQLFGIEPSCLAERKAYVEALTTLVRGGVNLESYIKENASLYPNPGGDGFSLRAAWPFVVLPAPSGSKNRKRERDERVIAGQVIDCNSAPETVSELMS